MIKDMDVYASRINGRRYDIGTMELWIKTFIEFAKEKGIK
jgi:UTP-glucose-1-phosphate uridylyltransferase